MPKNKELLSLYYGVRVQIRLGCLLQFCVLFCLSSFSISADPQIPNQLVLHVTVIDKKGKLIEGLQPADFQVIVDKVPQKIVGFSNRAVTSSIGILIDNSGSQYTGTKTKQELATALNRFLELTDGSSEYFTLAFNTGTTLLQDWTAARTSVVGRFDELTFKGSTALYDALYTSIQKVTSGRYPRHVLILISDGQDSLSKHSFTELRDFLRASDVTLYCVALISGSDAGSSLGKEGQGVLDELASLSGGRAFLLPPTAKPAALNEVFEFMATELRMQYRLVINTEKSVSSKWRKIKVTVAQTNEKGKRQEQVVRTRVAFE